MSPFRTVEGASVMAHVVIVGTSRFWGGYTDRVVGVHASVDGALDWCFHHMRRVEPADWSEVAKVALPSTFNGRVWCCYGKRVGYETLEMKA